MITPIGTWKKIGPTELEVGFTDTGDIGVVSKLDQAPEAIYFLALITKSDQIHLEYFIEPVTQTTRRVWVAPYAQAADDNLVTLIDQLISLRDNMPHVQQISFLTPEV